MKSIVDRLELQGYLASYIEYASELTDAPLAFHLGGALTSLSTCCGSRVIYPGYGGRNNWPNLYTLLIAPSGLYRKSTSVGIAEDIVSAVEPGLILSGEQSREKFLAILKETPNVMYPISEFAAILDLWAREYQAGLKALVVDLFDCRQEYSRQTLKDGKVTIQKPSLNILAASTIDWLREKLTEGDLRGGLMGRFILIPSDEKIADPGLHPKINQEKRQKLIDFLKGIHNLERSWVDVSKILTEFNEWVRRAERLMTQNPNPELLGFQSRLAAHTLKMMVLLCVSESPVSAKYVITNDQFRKGTILGKWLIDQAAGLAETGFTKSKTENSIQKLLQMAGSNSGVQRSEAIRMLHCNSREFEVIVQTAIQRGELAIMKKKSETKPSLWYKTNTKTEPEV